MRIYTGTGDGGQTGLLGGVRVAKSGLRIAAIGDVDELNATIGIAIGLRTVPDLHRLQCWLFDLGAELAAQQGSRYDVESIGEAHVRWLEAAIDAQMEALPPLRAFILPGGAPSGAALHHARTVCRRAERSMLALHEIEPVRENARVFLNRLSDYLFAAARTANRDAGVPDVEWHRQEEPC